MIIQVNIRRARRRELRVGVNVLAQQIAGLVVLRQHLALQTANVVHLSGILNAEVVIACCHAKDVETKVAGGVAAIGVADLEVPLHVHLDAAAAGDDLHMAPGAQVQPGVAGGQHPPAGFVQLDVAVVAVVDHVATGVVPVVVLALAKGKRRPVVGLIIAIGHEVELGGEVVVGEVGVGALAGVFRRCGPAQLAG